MGNESNVSALYLTKLDHQQLYLALLLMMEYRCIRQNSSYV